MFRNTSTALHGFAGVLLATSILLLSGCATEARQGTQLAMEQKIATAKTKADHEELAQSYEQEATRLRAKAQEHQEMAKAYSGSGYLTEKWQWPQHCNALVQKYQDAANENAELAKLHRDFASKL